ncbi:hypothetical protein [Kitasatospora sp. GP82]|uniref:hypothetical protein n=1 Tax=Kitasatospora sp. GP82 TaxID=3035089 RepID=UPI002472FB2D|nr:hypothetical protein [Kitasatospora sp. GP82]MDH6127445.1 translation elongation factor EF-Tu-like GTPase [Kitasatospora sp. GP82]
MVTEARFSVENIFDLKGRTGVLVAGSVESGLVKGGMTLHDVSTGRQVRVTGIEFHAGSSLPGSATLVVDRRDTDSVRVGAVLVSSWA